MRRLRIEQEASVMNESIIVGIGVAAVGTLVGHHLRLEEMNEQWDKDERRRKSKRRRELAERELAVITEFADANMDLWNSILFCSPTGKFPSPEARTESGHQALLMHARANVAALSLGDEELEAGVKKLIQLWDRCNKLIDLATGDPRQGKRKELDEALAGIRTTTARIRRRGRELLEET
jgi:hypothetical protein